MRYRRLPNQAKVADSRFCIGASGVECVHVHAHVHVVHRMLCNMCTLQYTLPQGTKGQNETRETRERAAWLRGRRTAAQCTPMAHMGGVHRLKLCAKYLNEGSLRRTGAQ